MVMGGVKDVSGKTLEALRRSLVYVKGNGEPSKDIKVVSDRFLELRVAAE